MSIADMIERVRQEPPLSYPDDPFPDSRYICRVVDPVRWNRAEVERALETPIPPDLADLWDRCGGLLLYEDSTFWQWGLIVHGPSVADMVLLNQKYREDKDGRVLAGDLVFATFWGDSERVLIRCDRTSPDCGSIVIVTEMGPRSEWSTAAHSLEEFLSRFMDAHGEKYWENGYQRRMALSKNVIERARSEPSVARPGDPSSEARYVCNVLERRYWYYEDGGGVAGAFVSPDLDRLWNLCGGLILYEDSITHEGGLAVYAPPDPEIFTVNREYREEKGDDGRPEDMIFARFRDGGRERVLLRSDRYADDFDTVVIVPETGPRSKWPVVARSLEEFLVRFMDARGEKYWEHEDQKMLPEHGKDNR